MATSLLAKFWEVEKEYRISLGTYPEISLIDARKQRNILRGDIAKGINPALERREEKAISRGEFYFEHIARECVNKQANRWTEGHSALTLRRLEMHIFPYLRSRPISKITAPGLLKVLQRVEKKGALEVIIQ